MYSLYMLPAVHLHSAWTSGLHSQAFLSSHGALSQWQPAGSELPTTVIVTGPRHEKYSKLIIGSSSLAGYQGMRLVIESGGGKC